MNVIGRGVSILAAAAAFAGFGQGLATASVQWTNDTYQYDSPFHLDSVTVGIIWGNRTAEIQGVVGRAMQDNPGYTIVYFDGFAGSTKVASTFRRTPSGSGHTDFHFDFGDPTLAGGIDRIRIQLCANKPDGTHEFCGPQQNEIRD